ncbi:Putative methyltransferase [Legionella beliardensis]|uniref:Methyltransferase n=1 Tax=Legionella beliardensis TaxID=91822 RepID=A0A378HX92_9GAMM|nr:class I SAM-dependent methyltransferase [Legionella beliardensis]STX27538.1 Putative methyltransferase [Legionella beliardensis]
MTNEKYDFEIGESGLSYDLLDESYNASTKKFLLDAGLAKGMKVLDVGCGAGVMTSWIANYVGKEGYVTAIDNSPEQLKVTHRTLQQNKIANVSTTVLSAYDIAELGENYDLIYCRFLLHHLYSPRKAIKIFYENLNDGGIYVGEEGIISHMFAYPPTFAWQGYSPALVLPEQEIEGMRRDGDIGMKLFYECRKIGFEIINCGLVQPILWQESQKMKLLEGLNAFKKTDLEQGTSEEEWQKKYDETVRFSKDDKQIIGFYGSFQVACRK